MATKKTTWYFVGFIILIGAALLIWLFQINDNTTKPANLEDKLVLGDGELPQEITMDNTKIFAKNGANDVFVIQLVEGELKDTFKGTVLTDEVCEPDVYGYYHCWNNIELSNGEIIRGLTIHDMEGGVECLTPESEVVVTPYKDGYFLLQR